jgi:hypothetical protein
MNPRKTSARSQKRLRKTRVSSTAKANSKRSNRKRAVGGEKKKRVAQTPVPPSAGSLAPIPHPAKTDVPHATLIQLLAVVRALLALGGAATVAAVAELLAREGISLRHTGYGLADGAAVIGLVRRKGPQFVLTDSSRVLAGTAPGSAGEREMLRAAMLSNPFIASVVSGPDVPKDQLAQLVRAAGFSETSVTRRVPCLRVWRRWFQAGGQVANRRSTQPNMGDRRSPGSGSDAPG